MCGQCNIQLHDDLMLSLLERNPNPKTQQNATIKINCLLAFGQHTLHLLDRTSLIILVAFYFEWICDPEKGDDDPDIHLNEPLAILCCSSSSFEYILLVRCELNITTR